MPRRSTGLRADVPVSFSVRCTDVDAAWALRIGARRRHDDVGYRLDRVRNADASVRGAAADLYLALWNRIGPERLVVEGDPGVLGQFLQTVHVRWS